MSDLGEFRPARPLVLIGCGNMGQAMLRGWLAHGLSSDGLILVEPDESRLAALGDAIEGAYRVSNIGELDAALNPRAVVFAIKPQVLPQVLGKAGHLVHADTVFLSIVAGKPLAFFADRLGAEAAVVRAMPNTPASVARAITVACANSRVDDRQKALCDGLLSAIGRVVWTEHEDWLDAVTAVSGSGPAYVFHLVECLARAGEAAGLPAELAELLARETVSGAGELLRQSNMSAADLRCAVTSPGGTTEAALAVLMADEAFATLLRRAVERATARSRELSG